MTAPVPPVTFVYADFIGFYPEFAGVSEPQMTNYFGLAGSYFGNETGNPAFRTGIANMTRISYMATAHIAWLLAPRDELGNPASTGQMSPQTVGQVTNASEGSVSAGLAAVATGANELAAWWAQTRYGLMYWQATSQFRTAQYLAMPTIVAGPGMFGWPFIGGRVR